MAGITTMRTGRTRTVAALAGAFMAICAAGTNAVAAGLPGGASSLSETHGDWTVTCRMTGKSEPVKPGCSLSQQQTNRQKQRAIAIELAPVDGGVHGALVLPFGVAVTKTVQTDVDKTPLGEPRAFSTCLPAGCIVPLTISPEGVDQMKAGSKLNVAATSVDGAEFTLPISLDGFTSALERTRELVR